VRKGGKGKGRKREKVRRRLETGGKREIGVVRERGEEWGEGDVGKEGGIYGNGETGEVVEGGRGGGEDLRKGGKVRGEGGWSFQAV